MKNILIVEDIGETRKWLTDIALSAFQHAKIEQSTTMREGLTAVARQHYDLALIDLGLPDGSGLDILRALKAKSDESSEETMCIVTTVLGDDAHIVAALSAGAQGYLLKEQTSDMLTQQLKQLSQGVPALSPAIARRVMEHFRFTGPAGPSEGNLSDREQEVLALISRGMRNIDVANALNLTEHTVASHIKSIYRKLGINSRAEASWHAAQMGLGVGASKRQ